MLTVAIPKRNKLQNIIVLTPKDGDLPETDGNEGDLWERIKRAEKAKNHKTT